MDTALNSFDKMVGNPEETSKAKSNGIPLSDKCPVSVIDEYIASTKELNTAKVRQEETALQIREHAKDAYLDLAVQDTFSKSVRFPGSDGSVRVTHTDRFSVSGSENELKSFDKDYEKHFEKTRVVTVKAEVFKRDDLLTKFMSKFTREELKEFFDINYKIKTVKGFDKIHAEMGTRKRNLLAESVSQASPGITII